MMDNPVFLRFGGGLNTSASEDEIDARESADGRNYKLDFKNKTFRPRPPFDLLDTAPNGLPIQGMINLEQVDGTYRVAVQAGDKVYEYINGSFVVAEIATVSPSARLRGRIEHNWTLTSEVLITDLALQDTVMKWDGTIFEHVSFTGIASLKAKYCNIENDRAIFANIDTGADEKHLIIASKIEDYKIVTNANKPSSAIGEGDAFYLTASDLRAVNGIAHAFGNISFSTELGNVYTLLGSNSQDYNLQTLYPRSGASGDEAFEFIGNDILYGRIGRIESLSASEKYGDVETDDISKWISDEINTHKNWTIAHNNRTQESFVSAEGESELWLFKKAMIGEGLSPWCRYTTKHAFAFQPTCIMNMIDPDDGLEYVFMGDSSGNFYRLEGKGDGDGGTDDIISEFVTGLSSVPVGDLIEIDGQVKYKKNEAFDVNITAMFQGITANFADTTMNMDAAQGGEYYGGEVYYSGDFYYGSQFKGVFLRKNFDIGGSGEDIQIKVRVEGKTDFEISEVKIDFKES